ncbi:thioesterase family protein [Streptomyces buecherae]|uniref:thioesterase family protein n=1 Tax=Streptomyces buecherae TaxID=2763006 RepID=UPI00379F0C24
MNSSQPVPRTDLAALVGRTATLTHVVTEADSARQWGNDIDVLATPVLLWLSEIAAMKVLGDAVTEPSMTVGLSHASQHLAPTPTGDTVTLTAELTAVEGRRLVFDVVGHDSVDTVLRGQHERAVVDRPRFVEKLAHRTHS